MKNADALKQKKLFLFDIDGTLAIGDTLYEGSADLLNWIYANGGKSYFITNNSTKSGQDYVEKFHRAFHRGPVHHLRLYDYPVFKGKLCR